MNKKIQFVVKALACLAILLWAVYTLRLLAMIASIGFCISLFVKYSRKKVWLILGFGILALIIPFQPYAVTFINADGKPKIISCCPGSPYVRTWQSVKKKQQAGECKLCSDISTGFNPRYFLVW